VQVHADLQQALGRAFSVTDLFQYCTVRSLGNYLAGKVSPQLADGDIAERVRKRQSVMANQRRSKQLL